MKLKVGNSDGTGCLNDAQRVNELVAQSINEPGTMDKWLRLDANQSWSVNQAASFGNALTPDAVRAIEYVEEPLRIDPDNAALTRTLYRDLRLDSPTWRLLTIALDETLVQRGEGDVTELLKYISLAQISEKQGVAWCVVVKPALLSLDCFFLTQKHGTITISCTFESGFTLAYLVCVASFFGGSHGVHAKIDMAAASSSTAEFISIIQDDGRGGKSVQVSKALELIERFSKIDSFV